MTPMAPHLTAFLRERLPMQRGASPHTCASYAYTFQLLLTYASQRLAPATFRSLLGVSRCTHGDGVSRLSRGGAGQSSQYAQHALSRDHLVHALRRVSCAVHPGAEPSDPRHSNEKNRCTARQAPLHG